VLMGELPTASACTGHIVLLGDSIFDNSAYVGGGPDVIAQLRQELPGWRCTLLALDGDVISGVPTRPAAAGAPTLGGGSAGHAGGCP
jgi:hypothetical protein